MATESKMECLLAGCQDAKQKAMSLAAFLKTAKARKFVDTIYGMVGEGISAYSWASGRELQLSLYVKDLEGFKDQRLAGILEAMEYLNPFETSTSEYAAAYNKTFTYRFRMDGDQGYETPYAPRVYIAIEATIKTDSETCQRVVVGMTDAKPQPIYKLVCDGQEEPGAPE